MKVFVNECVNRQLMRYLSGHIFVHILETSLRGTQNGALLNALANDYDVFLTLDKNIPFQQNLRRFPLAFVVMQARSNRIEDLLPLVPDLLVTLDGIAASGGVAGDLFEIASASS